MDELAGSAGRGQHDCARSGTLATTGANLAPIVLVTLLLLGVGGTLVVARRRGRAS